MSYAAQARRTLQLLEATPHWKRLQELQPELDTDTVRAIVEEAAKWAEQVLAPLNTSGDQEGCSLQEGRVRTPPGYPEAYRQFAQSGWLGMTASEDYGGQGLPLLLYAACEPLFERANMAFMMAPGAVHAAMHLLDSVAEPAVAEEWTPRLVSGEWAATICISEPGAGSDVGRIRTRATRTQSGWRVSGQKVWISFGDHDLSERIGHCLLARTSDDPGTRGLSLFLVPNQTESGAPNGITVGGLEKKMGIHGSPTCSLIFEHSEAVLLGQAERGLPQLFRMIEIMRLLVGCQGLGIASGATETALQYAMERRQGGPPREEPLPILRHADVQRQLLEMESQTEILRATVLEMASVMDLARLEPEEAVRAEYADLAAWMLPLVKTFGAETGFAVASQAIQVLGGAGYTQDWPLEQAVRDIRIAAIYEGTTGMQAQDFLMRRLWRDEGRGLSVFLRQARQEASTLREQVPEISSTAEQVWREFEELSDRVLDYRSTPRQGEAVADAYLRAGWIAASCWMALRLLETAHGAILSEFVLLTAQESFRVQAKKCLLLAELLGSRYLEEDA
jgi:alkylation response protein AidB-like acyl-CoA dehydrogenase